MQLNIKNEEAREMAAELAELTGESMTQAVTNAIRERLDRNREAQAQQMREIEAIVGEYQQLGAHDTRSLREVNADLYDHDGLPR